MAPFAHAIFALGNVQESLTLHHTAMDPDSDGGNASSSAAAAAFASTTLQRLVAQSLPAGTLVVPDALNVMNQCASEFLRSLSAHLAAVAGDKSITPAMIDTALEQMGFDDYAEGSAKATAAAAAAKPVRSEQ